MTKPNHDLEPMEAKLVVDLPEGGDWQFEPKWDGFRCLAFCRGEDVDLRSKSGKPLGRYFPEIVQAFLKNPHHNLFVVGEEKDFRGVIPLHDLKPHLGDVELAKVAIAEDLLHDNFPTVNPETTLAKTLETFFTHAGERIPVVEKGRGRKLVGSISKTDLLITIAQAAKPGRTE